MKRWLRRAWIATFYVYAAAVVLLPVLWAVFGESWWLLILLRYAPPGVFLVPVAVLGLPLLLLRPRGHAVAAVALALWVVFGLMGFEWPRKAAPDGAELTAVTLNIRAGLEVEAPALAAFLRDSGADVVALQEARKPSAAPRPDPVPELVRLLPEFQVARGGLRDELVILSRHPVLSTRVYELAGLSEALEARIDFRGRPLRVLDVHLMTGDPRGALRGQGFAFRRRLQLTAETRHLQTQALLDLLVGESVPTLLMGDFNTPPHSASHERLSRVLVDGFGAAGLGFGYTYKSSLPVWRIDYVWASTELGVARSEVLPERVSDHRAVRTVVHVPGAR